MTSHGHKFFISGFETRRPFHYNSGLFRSVAFHLFSSRRVLPQKLVDKPKSQVRIWLFYYLYTNHETILYSCAALYKSYDCVHKETTILCTKLLIASLDISSPVASIIDLGWHGTFINPSLMRDALEKVI